MIAPIVNLKEFILLLDYQVQGFSSWSFDAFYIDIVSYSNVVRQIQFRQNLIYVILLDNLIRRVCIKC